MRTIAKFLIIGLAFFLSAQFFSGISANSFFHAFLAAVVIGIINVSIKPILQFLTFPITLVTFGLFLLVINAGMIELMDWFVRGFNVENFWWALLLSFILSVTNWMLPKPEHNRIEYHKD